MFYTSEIQTGKRPRLAPNQNKLLNYKDVNAYIRLGKRDKLETYLGKVQGDIYRLAKTDLESAKSRFLCLVTIIVISVLEIGAPQKTEKLIIRTAQHLEQINDAENLRKYIIAFLRSANQCTNPESNTYSIKIVEHVKHIIFNRYHEKLTDEKVAGEVQLSRSHFRHLFKTVTGKPFYAFLNEVRLLEARKLLETTNLTVKEVCAKVGYSNLSTFYRAYKSYYNVPPKRCGAASF